MSTLHTFATLAEWVDFAAERIASAAEWAVPQRGRFLLALSGGGTPRPLYERLASEPFRGRIPWAKTHIFWADERCVPPTDPESNYHMAHESLLRHVPIPALNIHRVQGELPPATAAEAYCADLLTLANAEYSWPRLDVVILGMGTDGHTASLFPGSPLVYSGAAVPVTADYGGRPAQRVTLTPAVFNDARLVLFLITGAEKMAMVTAVRQGPPQPLQLPAQRIHPTHGELLWLVQE